MKIPLDSIVVLDRQRADKGNIEDLAASLKHEGLINDILVKPLPDGKWQLVAGERRTLAAKSLGWTSIGAKDRVAFGTEDKLVADLSPTDLKILEFVENDKRKELDWKEKCLTLADLHLSKQLENNFSKSWTQEKLVSLTGYKKSSIWYMIQIARELADKESNIHTCRTYFEAVQFILKKNAERLAYDEIQRRRAATAAATASGVETEQPSDQPLQGLEESEDGEAPPPPEQRVVIQALPNFDTTKVMLCVLLRNPTNALIMQCRELLRDSGHMVAWYDNYWDYHNAWLLHRNQVAPFPLVWNKITVEAPSKYPFTPNAAFGLLMRKTTPTEDWPNPGQSVVAAIAETNDLPLAVVDFCLKDLQPVGRAVHIGPGISAVDVATLDRVPIFMEPDDIEREAKTQSLREHYERVVPNCKIEIISPKRP